MCFHTVVSKIQKVYHGTPVKKGINFCFSVHTKIALSSKLLGWCFYFCFVLFFCLFGLFWKLLPWVHSVESHDLPQKANIFAIPVVENAVFLTTEVGYHCAMQILQRSGGEFYLQGHIFVG